MNWWLWNASMDAPMIDAKPLYGCLVPTRMPLSSVTTYDEVLPWKTRLVIHEQVISDDQSQSLLAQMSSRLSVIDLRSFFLDAPLIELQAHRRIFCEVFGHSAARADCG